MGRPENRQPWLDAGLRVLADEGWSSLGPERLASELGKSKGSFYHYFADLPGYVDALLVHYTEVGLKQPTKALEGIVSPRDRLNSLIHAAAYQPHPGVDRALREGFRTDERVVRFLTNLDAQRQKVVRECFASAGFSGAEAELFATTLYWLLIGALNVFPRPEASVLERSLLKLVEVVWKKNHPPAGNAGTGGGQKNHKDL